MNKALDNFLTSLGKKTINSIADYCNGNIRSNMLDKHILTDLVSNTIESIPDNTNAVKRSLYKLTGIRKSVVYMVDENGSKRYIQ